MKRHLAFALAVAAMAAGAMMLPPIAQDPAYHLFADHRSVFGIQNGWNVLSNLAIGVAGALGLAAVFTRKAYRFACGGPAACRAYVALFAGAVLTAAGSMYYHLVPDNAHLVWDRLPLALGFMALLTAVLAERVSMPLASLLFVPLLAFGAGSVLYWHATEINGAGDLRWYALVQFGTLPAIALLLFLYPAPTLGTRYIVAALAAYSAAKGLELADSPIFALGQFVSGHTLKHLAAAVGVGCLATMIRTRATSANENALQN